MIARALAWALLALAAFPAAAGAHASIVRTVPADTAVLRAEPATVRLQWSEPVDLGPKSIQLLNADGKVVATPPAAHAGPDAAVVKLPPGLAHGTYVVAWRVVSADSHPVAGAFSFSIGTPSAVVDTAPRGVSAAVGGLDAVGRVIAFAGLAVSLGGACVLLLLWPEGPRSRRGRRLVWWGVGALLGGTLLVLALQGPYATGGSVTGVFDPSLLSFSLGTRFGHALVARLLLGAAFAVLVARQKLWGAGACAVLLLFTWTLVDHSRTGVQTWLGVPVASVHLLAMALWLGGLALLLVCMLGDEPSLAPVVGRFSRLALPCFVALGITGVYLSYRQSGELPALPATGFGRLLLVKSAIVLGIVGLAHFSRRAVRRGGPDLTHSLKRTVTGEAILGVGVLGLTAALVNSAPARVSYAPPFAKSIPAPAAAGPGLAGGHIQVHMEPAKEGENVADVFLVRRNGELYPAPELTAQLIPPGGVGPLKVALTPAEPGHYVADRLSIPYTGAWKLRLEIRTSDIDEADVDVPVRNPMRSLLLALALLAVAPAAASAHISVRPDAAKPGQTAALAFVVPNERSDATTVGVSVFLPPGLKTVDVPPHTGWTSVLKRTGGDVTEIDWTLKRQAEAIAGTDSQDFAVTLGPLPQGEQVVFKALQTYADGQVVRWIQDPTADADRPAAVLSLGGRSSGGSSSLGFVILALVLVAAMAVGVLLARRRRR